MRAAALAVLALLAAAQDPPRVSLDRTGSLADLAQAFSEATGTPVVIDENVKLDPKPLTIKVADVTFFEALDALCRAHGNIRSAAPPYGAEEGGVTLRPGPWADYPSVYTPDAKVIVSEYAAFNAVTSAGSQRFGRVYLSVLGAPWLRVQTGPGAKPTWTLDQALDADGKDLLVPPRDPEPAQTVDLIYSPRFWKGNSTSRVFRLRAFDPDRGLQVLKGSVSLSVSATKEVEIPLAVGKSVDTPVGKLGVDAVREPDATAAFPTWRVAFTLKEPKPGTSLRQAFEGRFRCDALPGRVYLLTLPKDGVSFEAVIRGPQNLPPSLKIMVRDGDRRTEIPFEFKNVRF